MDCRKWFLLAFSISFLSGGCLTQRQETLPEDKQSTSFQFPMSLMPKPKTKNQPKVETCLKGGYFLEKQAFGDKMSPRDRELMLGRARKAYKQALSIDPGNAKALAGIARVYTHLKDYNHAMEAYQHATKLHPNDSELWLDLGMCHFRQKQFAEGIIALRKSAKADPENRDRVTTLGYALARAGQVTEALEVLGQIHGPAQAHYKVGRMVLHMNQPELAKQYFEESLRLDPSLQPAQNMLAQMNDDAKNGSGNVANISLTSH